MSRFLIIACSRSSRSRRNAAKSMSAYGRDPHRLHVGLGGTVPVRIADVHWSALPWMVRRGAVKMTNLLRMRGGAEVFRAPMRRLRRTSFPPAHAGPMGVRSGAFRLRSRNPDVRGCPGQVRCLPIAGPCPEVWCGACNGAAGARSRRWRGAGSGCCPISGGHRPAIGAGRRTRGACSERTAPAAGPGPRLREAQDA